MDQEGLQKAELKEDQYVEQEREQNLDQESYNEREHEVQDGMEQEINQDREKDVEQEVEQRLMMEWEPLDESLRSRSARKDGEEETVKIVEVCSPWKIHVVAARHWNNWEMLREAVAREGDTAQTRYLETLTKGDKALLYVNQRWERVTIKTVGEGCQTKVKLIDVGSSLEVPTGDLREMSLKLKKSRCLTEAINLAGVEFRPDESWNISLSESLREILPVDKILTFKRLRQGGVLGDLFLEKTDEDQETVKVSVAQLLTELHEESLQNNNNNHPRSGKTMEKLRLNKRPTLSPLLPASGFFRAKILHIDGEGVVWVVPNDHIKLLSEVAIRTSSCTALMEEDQVDIGKLLVVQAGRTLVRGRILELEEEQVVFLNVDTGEPGQCSLQAVFAISPGLLSIPPLAVPIMLYGMKRRNQSQLEGDRDLTRILATIPRSQVTVSLLEPGPESSFPLPAQVRYREEGEGELERSLGLTLLAGGLMSVVTSHTDWTRQLQLTGLQWLNLPSSLPLTRLPHPFPLAPGLWLSVTVQAVNFPLDEEKEPSIESVWANRVSCHLLPLNTSLSFDFCQREITNSARLSKTALESLEVAYEDRREKMRVVAEQEGGVKDVKPGDGVLVFVNQEWCRAEVLRYLRDQVVQVFYTDYGHDGGASTEDLRALKEGRLEPVQVREFFFKMPETNEVD